MTVMIFERINPGSRFVSRRIHVPKNVREWSKIQSAIDTRKHGQKARLSDIYLGLVSFALSDKKKIVYERKITNDEPGLVMQFPDNVYREIEKIKAGIKEGKFKRNGEGVIDILDIFTCLLEAGFDKATKI